MKASDAKASVYMQFHTVHAETATLYFFPASSEAPDLLWPFIPFSF